MVKHYRLTARAEKVRVIRGHLTYSTFNSKVRLSPCRVHLHFAWVYGRCRHFRSYCLRSESPMGSVAVFGIVDMRESLRPVPKRLRTLLFAIPLLSNTVSSETGLVTVELFEFARKGPP